MTLPKMPNAGAFDQRLQLQMLAVTQAGEARAETWMSWGAERWAKALPLTGRDLIAASALQHEATVRFHIRWVDGVHAGMRVLWRGRVHQIVGDPVDIDGGRHTLELLCKVGPDES